MAAVAQHGAKMAAKGILLEQGGLLPSRFGAMVEVANGTVNVTDGPFTETKELVGGYAILKADSLEHAVRLGREFMQLHAYVLGPSYQGRDLEIRHCSTARCRRSRRRRPAPAGPPDARDDRRVPDVAVLTTSQLSDDDRAELRRLMDEAFAGDFTGDDWAHALGGWHALIREGGRVVAHAAVVERPDPGGAAAERAGYVEAVAVRPPLQRRGLGSAVMAALAPLIRDRFDLGVLSSGEWSFYERLGWERWRGPPSCGTPRALRSARPTTTTGSWCFGARLTTASTWPCRPPAKLAPATPGDSQVSSVVATAGRRTHRERPITVEICLARSLP